MIYILPIPQKPDPDEDFNFIIQQLRRLTVYELDTLAHAAILVSDEKVRLETK